MFICVKVFKIINAVLYCTNITKENKRYFAISKIKTIIKRICEQMIRRIKYIRNTILFTLNKKGVGH